MNLAPVLDRWALAFVTDPFAFSGGAAFPWSSASLTTASRHAFGNRHTRASAHALGELLAPHHDRDSRAITSRQLHVLLAIAAADLLERDQLAALLAHYRDPGVATWYLPVSVTALRQTLHTVIGPYEPTKRARLLMSLADHHREELVRWSPTTTPFAPAFLDACARGTDEATVREHIAMNPHTGTRTLALLAEDTRPEVRTAVAGNPRVTPPLLAILALDPSIGVQLAVATSASTPSDALDELASHHEPEIRVGVAANPNTAPTTLARMVSRERLFMRDVRIAVAGNPNTTPTTRSALTSDPDWAVREAVGASVVTESELLTVLADDPHPHVRRAVAASGRVSPLLLDSLARDHDWDVRATVAQHHGTEAHTRNRLAGDPYPHVREALAGNPRTSARLLRRLAADPDGNVRLAVANHPSADERALGVLRRDRDHNVRRAIAARRWPGLPIGIPEDNTGSHLAARQRTAAFTDAHEQYYSNVQTGVSAELAILAPIVERLGIAVAALAAGARPASSEVRDAATLPGPDDLTFPTAAIAQARFNDAPIPVRVLTNGRAQRRNGKMMRNCTLSDPQVAACQRGTKILAMFEHQGQRYNVAWVHCDDHWVTDDLKGIENTRPPRIVESLAQQLTARLEGLEPNPPLTLPQPGAGIHLGLGLGTAGMAWPEPPKQLTLF